MTPRSAEAAIWIPACLGLAACCALSGGPSVCSVGEPERPQLSSEIPRILGEVPDVDASGQPLGDWVDVALTDAALSCGLRETGVVQCWGRGDIPPPGVFSEIVAGTDVVCALPEDERDPLVCWSDGDPGSAKTFTGSSLDVAHSFAVGDNTLCTDRGTCVGGNSLGGLRLWSPVEMSQRDLPCDGSECIEPSDPAVPARMVAMDRGVGLWCGVREADAALQCWGRAPTYAEPPRGRYVDVAVGGDFACAVSEEGTLVCWGDPAMVDGAPVGLAVTALDAALNRACVVADGRMFCWQRDGSAPQMRECYDTVGAGGLLDCDNVDVCEMSGFDQGRCCSCNPRLCEACP